MLKTLLEIYNKHKVGDWPDKNSSHSYIEVYEKILAPYRMAALNVLEIGLMSGESLRMWTKYFNSDLRSTHCNVYGMDCSETPVNGLADLRPIIAEGKHNIVIGDATNPLDIAKHFSGMDFSVIIDDGNHEIISQLRSYEILSKYLSDGGCYIIEDIQNIDETRELFEKIDATKKVEIFDRRHIKNRYDDVLVIIKEK